MYPHELLRASVITALASSAAAAAAAAEGFASISSGPGGAGEEFPEDEDLDNGLLGDDDLEDVEEEEGLAADEVRWFWRY